MYKCDSVIVMSKKKIRVAQKYADRETEDIVKQLQVDQVRDKKPVNRNKICEILKYYFNAFLKVWYESDDDITFKPGINIKISDLLKNNTGF